MLMMLILGSSIVLDAPVPSAAAITAARRYEARPAQQTDPRVRFRFLAPVKDAASNGRIVCAIQVLRADPTIDPEMVVTLEQQVDPEMVFPSPCAGSAEVAGER
jgi:hypothetical protein